MTTGLALVLTLLAGRAVAQAQPLIAVLLVNDDGEAELAGRVEGQTSDLELSLVVERRAAGAGGPDLAEAAVIAGRHRARVVVWFQRDASSWLVHIAEPSEDREFVRRVAVASQGDLASSATAEGVALVVRGALQALAAGGSIGVAEPLAATSSDWRRGFAAIGWRAVSAGGPSIHHGVAARAGMASGRWHGDITTGFYPGVAIDDQTATIELERWSFAAGVGVELAPGAGWRAGLALDAGATRFARVTTRAEGTLDPTPPEITWSPSGSGRVRLARRLAGRAWLELAIGAEVLLRAPEFGVQSGGSFVIHTRLRPVEPFGALGLLIDFG
jgi:hypothetical protein